MPKPLLLQSVGDIGRYTQNGTVFELIELMDQLRGELDRGVEPSSVVQTDIHCRVTEARDRVRTITDQAIRAAQRDRDQFESAAYAFDAALTRWRYQKQQVEAQQTPPSTSAP